MKNIEVTLAPRQRINAGNYKNISDITFTYIEEVDGVSGVLSDVSSILHKIDPSGILYVVSVREIT